MYLWSVVGYLRAGFAYHGWALLHSLDLKRPFVQSPTLSIPSNQSECSSKVFFGQVTILFVSHSQMKEKGIP